MIAPPFPMDAHFVLRSKRRDGSESVHKIKIPVLGFDDAGEPWVVDEGDKEATLAADYGEFTGLSPATREFMGCAPGWFLFVWVDGEPPAGLLLPIAAWKVGSESMIPVVSINQDTPRLRAIDWDEEEELFHYGEIFGPGQDLPTPARLEIMAAERAAAKAA